MISRHYLRGAQVAVLAALLLALSACGGGDRNASPDNTVQVQSGFFKSAAARRTNVNGFEQIVADREVLITMREDVTPGQYDDLVSHLKSMDIERLGEILDLRMFQLRLKISGKEDEVIESVRKLPGVDRASLNFAVSTTRANPPSSAPLGAVTTGSPQRERPAAVSADGGYWRSVIELGAAQEVEDALGVTTASRIAVVDTGMPMSQHVLSEARLNRVDASGAILADDSTKDVENHGAWVSAFAAGFSSYASGVSRHSDLLSVDIYDSECEGVFKSWGCPFGIGLQFLTELMAGVRTALQSDARVINVSWGGEAPCSAAESVRLSSQRAFRESLKPLVNLARSRDKMIVFAAGNFCEKRDFQLLESIDDPAEDSWSSHVLIVGASTSSDRDALFSRMGDVVNLVAPGEDVGWGQGTASGTSFSAPLVSGTAALLEGIAPDLSSPETRHLILQNAEPELVFADAKSAKYRGYDGENAFTPNRVLKAGPAAVAARVVRGVPLRTLDTISLKRDETKEVSFDIQIPATSVAALDVVFLVDVSSSFADDIANFKSQAGAILDALKSRGIDVQFGVSSFADFPSTPYGEFGDAAYRRFTRITGDKAAVLSGIDTLQARGGGDEREAQLEALFQVATGLGRDIDGNRVYDFASGDIPPQPMGWRTGAAKVVLFATDAGFHDADTQSAYPGAGFSATVAALRSQGIRVIGLQSGSTSAATVDIQRLVNATGGAIYELSNDSAQITQVIIAGIDVSLAQVEVTTEKIAGAAWVTQVTQSKVAAAPGEKVTITASLVGRRSQSVADLPYDVYLWVRGNGSALLQRVRIPITVPR